MGEDDDHREQPETAALRVTEGQFRAFFTASSDVVYRMSPDWSEMRQLQGRNFIPDTNRPSGTWLTEYIYSDDQTAVMAVIAEAIRTTTNFEMEHRVRRVDGNVGWVFSRAVPLLGSNGEVVEWIGAAQDVTERKRAEQALLASEERYRRLFSQMNEGYCLLEPIFDQDNRPIDYRFLEVNPAFTAATGLVDAVGKRIHDLVPDLQMSWVEFYGMVALTGEPDRRVGEADGMNRWFDVSAFKVGGPSSRTVAVFFNNVTEQKKAEAELRRSEERYRTLFNSIDEGFCIVESLYDSNGHPIDYRFVEVNPTFEKQTGLLAPLGKKMRELVPGIEAHWIEVYGQVALTGEPVRFVNVAKDMGGRWFDVYACRVGGSESRKVAIVFNDITTRMQIDSEFKEASHRKDEFLAMLAHELRNPLAPIRNMLEVLKRADGKSDLVQPALTTMERQVGQMTRLIDDLLDVSRINMGKISLRLEKVELAAVVRQVVDAIQPASDAAQQELTVTLPARPVYVMADPARLAQVLGNLLHNACKFSRPGGQISLLAEQNGRDLTLTVRDAGIGIPNELLPKIFEMFAQGDQTLERSNSGLGIGLTLVRRLVEMHGGTVQASSAGPDCGSEFVVCLPLLIDELELAEPDSTPMVEATPAVARRILVVDDNHDSAESLAILLQLTGNETQLAFDGMEAVNAAASFRPDVILMDIGLPKLNGYEAARQIRSQPWGKALVLVAITGWGQDEDRRKSMEAGFDVHMVKPVHFDALRRLLDKKG